MCQLYGIGCATVADVRLRGAGARAGLKVAREYYIGAHTAYGMTMLRLGEVGNNLSIKKKRYCKIKWGKFE